ncbi:MAG: hypothetical protein ACXW32_13120, partial [Limisphaerales bacterium]
CSGLVVKHGIMKVAPRLPRFNELRINLCSPLVGRPRLVENMWTTLGAKLYEVAANAPELW